MVYAGRDVCFQNILCQYINVLGQNGPISSFPYKNCHNHNDLNIHYNRVLEIYQKMEHPTQQGFIELAAPPTTVVLNGG